MPVPGDTLTKRISLIDSSGVAITGATFSLSARDADGLPISPDMITELGDGIYEFSLPTTIASPAGNYYLQVTSDTVPLQVFELEWTVKPLGTPARWRPGDTVMDYVTVIDPSGNPVLGESFEIHARNTVGNEFPMAAPTELGDGTYRVALRTNRFDPPGLYYIQLRSHTLPTQVYEVEFVTGQPVNLTGGTSLTTLRRRVMQRFGDIVCCRATQNGTASTFIDEDNLVGEPGRYAGREILFVTGMNAGQKRYIPGSSRDTSSVTFQRPLPYGTMEGDEADITNAYGVGVTFQAVDAAINFAIDTARPRSRLPMHYRITGWDGSHIPIPAEVMGINEVYAIDRSGTQRMIRKSRTRGNGWFIDQPTRTIVINGNESRQIIGCDIVVNARVLPNLLVDGDDVTMMPLEWLVETAASHICLDTLLSKQASGDWGSKGMLYKGHADKLLTTLSPNIGPNYQAVN